MSVRDLLSPFRAWKQLLKNPVTIIDPINDRPGSERYRGFHQNDDEKCIGCGTCETICQNGAIDMLPAAETQQGDSGLRPRIDYGRCCWCALCVDVCMTGSLTMSNEYKWIETDPDAFRFTPGIDKKPWDNAELGYQRPDEQHLIAEQRIGMPEMDAQTRINSFDEIVDGYSIEQAKLEADRCVSCGLCIATCPIHMSIPEYIKTVRDGDYETGIKLLYETNPFSNVCGRVCTRKCESSCAARHEGDPIAIRWLKRHIIDQVPDDKIRSIIGDPKLATGKKVAIIGAGPAGLTAAYDLARNGHAVTVYEALDKAGGMTRYGIPYYRLPDDMLARDVDIIVSMGVKIEYNTRIGDDISMQQLQTDYDAVVLAIGLQAGRSTRIPGSEHKDTQSAVALLRKIGIAENNGAGFDVPESAVVIGGGNVAMDIARSLARFQKQQYNNVNVLLTAIDALEKFPADEEEISEALEEGVKIIPSRGPQEVIIKNDQVTGLRTWHVLSIFDEQGRFSPQYDDSDEQIFAADMVIEAIGQMAETDLLGEALTEQLDWHRGRIKIAEDGRTSVNWLWSAGDCVNGPDVVHAVADGHRVAQSVHQFLAVK